MERDKDNITIKCDGKKTITQKRKQAIKRQENNICVSDLNISLNHTSWSAGGFHYDE